MPYGLRWRHGTTDVEVEQFFQQVVVIASERHHCGVLSIVFSDSGRMKAFMVQCGYSDIHPFYIYKPQQNTTGMEWIYAVEKLCGYKGGVKACGLTLSTMNPVCRHSHVFGHQVGSKIKHCSAEEEVNTTQKNPHVASFIARVLSKPGSSALVIGAGSGSEWSAGSRGGARGGAGERRQAVSGADAAPDRGGLLSGQGDEAGGR